MTNEGADLRWVSLKRFTDFFEMVKVIREDMVESNPSAFALIPSAPSRKSRLLNDHSDPRFVEQRRVLLEHFLNRLLRIEAVASHDAFLKFCAVPGYD
jgi:hypothetical protein